MALPAGGAWSRLVAIRAIHGLVATWLERHQSFFATLSAGGAEHLALRAVIPATVGSISTTTAVSALGAAAWAALWVLVAAIAVELLVIHREGEFVATLGTLKGSVGNHIFHLSCS
jgi:hypothetical protein